MDLRALFLLTTFTGHAAPLLAVGAGALGIAGLVGNPESYAVLYATLGLASGIVWWGDYALNKYVNHVLERTPPSVQYRGAETIGDEVRVAISCLNAVPFECEWFFVTANNEIVGAIPATPTQVFPARIPTIIARERIDRNKVRDGYLEMRFRYTSLFAAKSGYPAELAQRTLAVAWLLEGDGLTPTELRTPPSSA